MASGLYDGSSAFRKAVDACCAALPVGQDLPLSHWVSGKLPMGQALTRAATLQPLLFTVQYALAGAWGEAGAKPDVVLGHSLGEYVAACVAGVMPLTVAMEMVCLRGRLIDGLSDTGGMLAVKAPLSELQAVLRGGFELDVAAVNASDQVVVSGRADEIDRLHGSLRAARIEAVRLPVTHAFHSRLLDPILDEFEAGLTAVEFKAPEIPWLSNLTGSLMQGAPDARYWREHLRQAVQFDSMVTQLRTMGVDHALEIGPKPLLSGIVGRALPHGCLPALIESAQGYETWLQQLGQAFCSGMVANVGGLFPQGRRIAFPGYPFAATRHWVDAPDVPADAVPEAAGSGLVQDASADSLLYDLIAGYWRIALGTSTLSRTSDFFMLGGNSLAAIQIRAAVQRDLDIDLPMAEMMKLRTLGEVVDAVGLALEVAVEDEVGEESEVTS